VNCAYGGAPLSWWNPDENGALLENAVAMLDRGGVIKPKAVLWIQGEAEAYTDSAGDYLERFTAFVGHLRAALDSPMLPFITVQLNRNLQPATEALDRQWGIVRNAQFQATEQISGVYIVPSGDLPLYDYIHNAPEADMIIGERCARAALCELYGRKINYKGCYVKRAIKVTDDTIRLKFGNIESWLNPLDPSVSLLPFDVEDSEGLVGPIAYETERDALTLTFPRKIGDGAVMHGAWRAMGAICLPRDCLRMPMLSFYGMKVEE
jgi:hypothetical protein